MFTETGGVVIVVVVVVNDVISSRCLLSSSAFPLFCRRTLRRVVVTLPRWKRMTILLLGVHADALLLRSSLRLRVSIVGLDVGDRVGIGVGDNLGVGDDVGDSVGDSVSDSVGVGVGVGVGVVVAELGTDIDDVRGGVSVACLCDEICGESGEYSSLRR